MPKIDGIQFLEALRETKPHVPVLIMTGYPGIASVTAAIRLGVSDYLAKPFTPEEVTRAVQRAIHAPPRGAAGAEADPPGVVVEPAPVGKTLFWDEAWFRLEGDGSACVGAVVPGLRGVTVKAIRFPRIGEVVYQGLPFAGVCIEGKPTIAIPSPVSGTVAGVNEVLARTPSLLLNDPCGEGWIACTCRTRFEEEARRWRFRRLILVNAHQATAEQQRRWLAALGCQVLQVARREEVPAAVRDPECQVLLLDGCSLGDRGPEMVGQINSLAPSMKVVVVACSGALAETAYRKHRIFYYAVEPFADNEIADVLDAAFRIPERHPSKAERSRVGPEPIGGIATTNRSGHKVQLFSAPGLLRCNEGLGWQIEQGLRERSLSVMVTPGEANLSPAGLAKAARAFHRLIVLSAKDSGLLPGGLARDTKPDWGTSPGESAGRIVLLGVQPDAVGGLARLDPRTSTALVEHIVREMASS
jgi:DNA-binding NarL/FixJ family response regulator/glycine cleavage system H lipoate-binding protein